MTESQVFRRIERKAIRLAEHVYQQLLDSIVSGALVPGDRVIQEQLAEAMNVSRTPVREALLRLEREGIMAEAGKRGFEVQALTEQTVRDIYEAREAIEGYAARLLAEQAGPKALARVEAAMGKTTSDGTVESAYEANRLAHRAVVAATDNAFLLDLFDSIWGRSIAMRIYADLYIARHGSAVLADTHRELLEALASGDGPRAEKTMVEHIRSGLEQQLEALRENV